MAVNLQMADSCLSCPLCRLVQKQQGNYGAAQAAFEQVCRLEPNHTEAMFQVLQALQLYYTNCAVSMTGLKPCLAA